MDLNFPCIPMRNTRLVNFLCRDARFQWRAGGEFEKVRAFSRARPDENRRERPRGGCSSSEQETEHQSGKLGPGLQRKQKFTSESLQRERGLGVRLQIEKHRSLWRT